MGLHRALVETGCLHAPIASKYWSRRKICVQADEGGYSQRCIADGQEHAADTCAASQAADEFPDCPATVNYIHATDAQEWPTDEQWRLLCPELSSGSECSREIAGSTHPASEWARTFVHNI